MSLVPMVVEQTSRGERSYDIYSRLLHFGRQRRVSHVRRVSNDDAVVLVGFLDASSLTLFVESSLQIVNSVDGGQHKVLYLHCGLKATIQKPHDPSVLRDSRREAFHLRKGVLYTRYGDLIGMPVETEESGLLDGSDRFRNIHLIFDKKPNDLGGAIPIPIEADLGWQCTIHLRCQRLRLFRCIHFHGQTNKPAKL